MTTSPLTPHQRSRRIAIVYDNTVRPDTTGEFCRRALEGLGHTVSHFLPAEAADIIPIYEVYLWMDDDRTPSLPTALHPLVHWAVDVPEDDSGVAERASALDYLFCAQRKSAARLRRLGIRNVNWLPLGCDSEVHKRLPGISAQHDICFVQHPSSWDEGCEQLATWFQSTYPRSFSGAVPSEQMAKICSASRVVFNCARFDEIGAVVFEAAACGSLLITNDLEENGLNLLFTPGRHLLTYQRGEELPTLIQRVLRDDAERARIADAGLRQAHSHHTYRQRLGDLLGVVFDGVDLDARFPVGDRTSPSHSDGAMGPLDEPVRQRLRGDEQRDDTTWELRQYIQGFEASAGDDGAAWNLLRGGRYPEAYEAFERVIRSTPTNPHALLGLGLAAEGQGVPATAALAYRTLLTRVLRDPNALRGLERAEGELAPGNGAGRTAPAYARPSR